MTPEEVRRILDPERRRAGFEAWKAEQREALRTDRVGDSGGICPPKGLDDVGQPEPAAAHPGEVETQLRFVGDLIVSNPRFPSLTGPPLAVWRDLGEAGGTVDKWDWDTLRFCRRAKLEGFKAWLPTPEQTGRFWGDDPMGPRRKLADELTQAREDAEVEMREALGRLVAADVSPRVECESVTPDDGGFVVRLVANAEGFVTDIPPPNEMSFDGGRSTGRFLRWEADDTRFQWRAYVLISREVAAERLHAVLGAEALAALQPKLEVRDGVATITRKTLRKDGDGEWVDCSDPWLFLPGDSITSGGKIGKVLEQGKRSLRVRWDGPVLRRKGGGG